MNYFKRALLGAFLVLFFVGCGEGGEGLRDLNHVYYGEIRAVERVKISDDGGGVAIGSILGGVGAGVVTENIWYGLGGALLGGIIGNQINESTGQRVEIYLDNRERISVILKNTSYRLYDRVAIYVNNRNEVVKTELIGW